MWHKISRERLVRKNVGRDVQVYLDVRTISYELKKTTNTLVRIADKCSDSTVERSCYTIMLGYVT
jgi:hypothetical protein